MNVIRESLAFPDAVIGRDAFHTYPLDGLRLVGGNESPSVYK